MGDSAPGPTPALALALPRRGVAVLVAVVLVVVATTVLVLTTRGGSGCTVATVLPARSPLLDTAGMAAQPDERLDTLTKAVDAMDAPIGDVRAGVGYDYDQWLHLYGVSGGVLAWTKNNAPVTYLDEESLAARWSLRPETRRTAWDASADRFLLLGLGARTSTSVGSFDLTSGRQRWCAELALHQRDGQPVATSFLASGDVLVALPGRGGITMTRLGAKQGQQVWHRTLTGVDRADFLAPIGDGVVVAGGAEEFRLADVNRTGPGGSVITAFSEKDGSTVWSWGGGADTVAHVVGITTDAVLVELRTPTGLQLVALSAANGALAWQRPLPEAAYSSTLRGETVLVKSAAQVVAYDATDGAERWSFPIPTDRTFFPYGFTLGLMPSLDADHVLVPTTTSLEVLDVVTGRHQDFSLPTDGVSTTYWPYQLLVTDHLIGVVTNTGGVLAERLPNR